MSRLTRRAMLSAGASLAGCSVLPERAYQERHEWPLRAERPSTASSPRGAPVLLVRGLRAGPGLDSRGLRVLLPDGAEHLDYWQEWAVPPPQGVAASLRQWLAASGLFTAVVQSGSDLRADFVLEPELTGFAADQAAGRARATLSIVLLRRLRNGTSFPVLQRSLTGEAPMTGTDAASVAHALLSALADLLSQVEMVLRPAVDGGQASR